MRFRNGLIGLLLLLMAMPGLNFAQESPVCSEDELLQIWQIQGTSDIPHCLDQKVKAYGIVTALIPNGFFMQTPTAESDQDPLTSDGIFVLTDVPPAAWGIAVGDTVEVVAKVKEFYNFTRLQPSGKKRVTVVAQDMPMPEAVDIGSMSYEWEAGVHPMERFEGMLVQVNDVLVSASTNHFDEFGISLSNERAFREMGIEADMSVNLAGTGLPEWDLNPEIIEVDPVEIGLDRQDVLAGSYVSVMGPVHYAYQDYQILPLILIIDPIEDVAYSVRERLEGEFTIASQNVENLFDLVDDPNRDDATFEDYVPDNEAEYQSRLVKLSAQIRENLGAPDILALQEVENWRVLNDLALQIHTDDPALTYIPCLLEGHDGRGIDVGYLINSKRVNVLDCYRMPGSYEAIQNNTQTDLFGRPPLIVDVELLLEDGASYTLHIINLHNKSLGGNDTTPTQNRRMEQAEFIAAYVEAMMQADPEAKVIILGDFNAFQFSDGIVDVVGIIQGQQDPAEALRSPERVYETGLINQIEKVAAAQRYSYVYNSQAQILDQMLVSPAVDAIVSAMEISRGNADGLDAWHLDEMMGSLRSSDHDGLVLFIKPSQ